MNGATLLPEGEATHANVVGGTIQGTVWEDTNANGKQETTEPVLPGVSVSLYASDDSSNGSSDATPQYVVTTDASGKYRFSGLVSGEYTVHIDEGSLPSTSGVWSNTFAPSGGSESTSGTIHLTRGATITGQDFGYFVQAPAIEVTKTGTAPGIVKVGEPVEWFFTITNTGNVELSDVELSDELAGLSEIAFDAWPDPEAPGVLPAGKSVTAHASSGLTQAEIDAAEAKNIVTVTAESAVATEPLTDSATAKVAIAGAAGIQVTKQASIAGRDDAGDAGPGDTIEYSFEVENTGQVTLVGVELYDPLLGMSKVTYGAWPGDEGQLKPGERVSASATVEITQEHVDAGGVQNIVTATAETPAGATVSDDDKATIPLAAVGSLELEKTVAVQGRDDPDETVVGDILMYSFTVENTGGLTLSEVTIVDELLSGAAGVTVDSWPGADGVLKPGETVTAKGSLTVTQQHIDEGGIENVATATGKTPKGVTVSDDDRAALSLPGVSGIDLVKRGTVVGSQGSDSKPEAGDTVSYEFVVTNTGTLTLSDVRLADELEGLSEITFGAWPGDEGQLSPGDEVTATAELEITQEHLDAGSVLHNTASALANAPDGSEVIGFDDYDLALDTVALIDLDKTVTVLSRGQVNSELLYTFTVTNVGKVTLNEVAVTDPLPGLHDWATGEWPNPDAEGSLAPGESVQMTAKLTVAQAHVDAGAINNTATAAGVPAQPDAETVTSSNSASLMLNNAPGIDLDKTVTVLSRGQVNSEVEYTFVVTNVGKSTLTGVTLDDPLIAEEDLVYGAWPDPAAEGTLAPGQSVTATARLTISQAHVNAGELKNTASVTGKSSRPAGDTVTHSDTAALSFEVTALIDLDKSVTLTDSGALGSLAEYTFVITNVGKVTLTDVQLADSLEGLSAVTFGDWPDPAAEGTLDPGQSVTATASLNVTQAHLDSGSLTNTATVQSKSPAGDTVSDVDTITARFTQTPEVSLTKESALSADGGSITYTMTARNSGNVTLTDVTVSDELEGLSGLEVAWPGDEGTLAPGEVVVATATLSITQQHRDEGTVTNTAHVTAVGVTTAVNDEASVTTLIPGAAALALEKEAAIVGGKDPADAVAGDTAEFSFALTNSGSLTLRDVTITDALAGLSEVTYGEWPDAARPGVLAPGDTVTATATLKLTQQHIDRGLLTNRAEATGLSLSGDAEANTAAEASLTFDALPLVSLSKHAEVLGEGIVGDTVRYDFEITNAGKSTLHDITLYDELEGLGEITFAEWPETKGTLLPGESVTAFAEIDITQSHVDLGKLVNTASVVATHDGGEVTDTAEASVTLVQAPGLSLIKRAELNAAETEITYEIEAHNSGNVTLSNVSLVDTLPGLSELETVWPGAEGTLAPGETVQATATLSITDEHRGTTVVNTATVSAEVPGGDVITDAASAEVAVAAEQTPEGPDDGGPGDDGKGDGKGDSKGDGKGDKPGGMLGNTGGASLTGLAVLALVALAGGTLLVRRRSRT
nr:SdrD B-like domain-containing protein [Leucobacter chinensis]